MTDVMIVAFIPLNGQTHTKKAQLIQQSVGMKFHFINERSIQSMSQKREKGYSQAGKPSADTIKTAIAAEDLEKAIHPTKRQNSKQ